MWDVNWIEIVTLSLVIGTFGFAYRKRVWNYLLRTQQFKLLVGSELCDGGNQSDLLQNVSYNSTQKIKVDTPQEITFLLRLKAKPKSFYFSLRYLDNKGEDLPQSQIEFKAISGFQAHPEYWSVDGRLDPDSGFKGTVQMSERRHAIKDCYIRITALIQQSCIGTLRFEGKYRIDDGHRLSAKSEAKLTIKINESASHKEGSHKEGSQTE